MNAIFFFRLAVHWSDILHAFDKAEKIFQSENYSQLSSGSGLKRRIRLTSLILLLAALVEHMLAWASFLYDRITQERMCGWEIGSYFYYLATTHLGLIYAELPAKWPTVVWGEYMNVSFTFGWNFIDLFIIIVSMGVASKFKRINERLEYFRERVRKLLVNISAITALCSFQIVNESFWEDIRCDYNAVCELQEFIDERIGNIVCLACFNDLYYVCLQLLNVAT